MPRQKVDIFLAELEKSSAPLFGLVKALRELFRAASADLSEEIKYGGIVFALGGVLVGGIFPYAEHVSVEFSHGAAFSDPAQILEGGGKKRRHVKITETADISAKKVADFIQQALIYRV